MNNREHLYAAEVGQDALDRQTAEAENRHACCGELRIQGHHQACRNYEQPDQTVMVDGQETLL